MPTVTIRVEGLEELRGKLTPELIQGPLKDFLQKSGFTIERRAKEKAPVDTGRLRASITTKVKPLEAEIGSPVVYAPWVEFGTRPHFPPVAALETWARRHGFSSAYVLARAISKRGTRPHPFLIPAAEESMGDI